MKKLRIFVYLFLFLFLAFIMFRANYAGKQYNGLGKNVNTTINFQEGNVRTKVKKHKKFGKHIDNPDNKIDLSDGEYVFLNEYKIKSGDNIVIKKVYKACKAGKCNLVTDENKKLTNSVYDDFEVFEHNKGLYLTYLNHKKGLINCKGRILIPTKYETIEKTPVEDVILVKKHKYCGLYDLKKMKNILNSIYNTVEPLDDTNWLITYAGKVGLLNYSNGQIKLIKPKYKSIVLKDKYIVTSLDSKLGLIDEKTGNVIVEPKYPIIELLNKADVEKDNILIFKTQIENRYGVIFYSKDNLTVIPPIYDDINYDGIVNVLSNGYWKMLNNKGNVVSRAK